MHKILKKQKLAESTYLMQIDAPLITKHSKPGNFIVLRIDEKGERIPLTIADYDKKTVTIIFKVAGKTTKELANLKKNNFILDFVGPLGNPSKIEDVQNICLVGGGAGIAGIYPITKKYNKNKKTKVTVIAGFKTKKDIFWENKLKKACDELIICTEDGSKGIKGLVTDSLINTLYKKKPELVVAIGPTTMMYEVCNITKQWVKTYVSLNPIMIDGLGMCGGCRVTVDGATKFVCVDGPEFNGHDIDWEELMNRNNIYEDEEKHICRLRK